MVRAKSAWASLLKPDFSPETASTLMQIQIHKVNGESCFEINPEEVAASKMKWKTAIIGQVMGNSSSFLNMKKFAEDNWTSKGLLEVQRKDEDLFVFRFQSEDSKQNILDLSPLPFGNRVLFLWPWSHDKPIQRLNLDAVPVWIKFPDLRLHHFTPHVLSGLGSMIGKPLFMDKLTTSQNRVSFARICVEIKAGGDLPKSLTFKDEDGNICTQEVIYEWLPSHCPKCKSFGHNCSSPPNQPKNINSASGRYQFPAKTNANPPNNHIHFGKNQNNPPQNLAVPNNSQPSSRIPTNHRTRRVNSSRSRHLDPPNNQAALPITQETSKDCNTQQVRSSNSPARPVTHPNRNSFAPLIGTNGEALDGENEDDLSPALGSTESEKDDSQDTEYNKTLAEHIRRINASLEKEQNDSSRYLSSSSDNEDHPPNKSHESNSQTHPPSKLKSIITKDNPSVGSPPGDQDLPTSSRHHRRYEKSKSPTLRSRYCSRGRPRGAKTKR